VLDLYPPVGGVWQLQVVATGVSRHCCCQSIHC